MVSRFLIAAVFIIYVLFLLSVIAPVRSQKRFWKAIYKIRAVMDLTSYWFFNLCGISAILYIVVMMIRGFLRNR